MMRAIGYYACWLGLFVSIICMVFAIGAIAMKLLATELNNDTISYCVVPDYGVYLPCRYVKHPDIEV